MIYVGRSAVLLATICAASLASIAPVTAQTRGNSTILYSESEGGKNLQEQYGFSSAVITPDGTVYLSGVVTAPSPDMTLEGAYERTYQTIGRTLERAGASWDDVVDITSFHTDIIAQIDTMSLVHKRYVTAPFPAWTAIQVDRLFPNRGTTEIKVVAKISQD